MTNGERLYQQFKKKKGARASVEALLKRADQGRTFEPINPLVDVYNSVSMTYGVPVGIEDRDKITGDMHLGIAKGGEAFDSVGDGKMSQPLKVKSFGTTTRVRFVVA